MSEQLPSGPCVCDAAGSPGVSRCLLTCPRRREQATTADTGRRCPRCDCADGHTQCEHCKVCEHARPSGSCQRPECGGEQHTDPWGTPVQCPHAPEPEAAPQVRFARRFVAVLPNQPDIHGVAFPSGHVIADVPYTGLMGFLAVGVITDENEGAVIHWADEEPS